VKELRDQIAELEEKALSAEEIAKKRASEATREAEQRFEKAKKTAEKYRSRFQQTQITNTIQTEAMNRARGAFINGDDLVRELSPHAVFEEDEETGEFTIRFKMNVPDEDNPKKKKEQILTIDEAAEYIRKEKPYLLRGSNAGGSGNRGGRFDKIDENQDVSKLSPQQKIALGYQQNERERASRR